MIGLLSVSSRFKRKLHIQLQQKMRTAITKAISSYHYENNRHIYGSALYGKFISIRNFSYGQHSDDKDGKTSPSTELSKQEKKASAFARYSSLARGALVSARHLIMNPKKTWNLIAETAQHYW